MLSPESYWKSVPTEVVGNLRWRLRLLELCEARPEYRYAVVEMCRQDLFFFVNVFVWQVNPKSVGHEDGPFILWDFQRDLLRSSLDRLLGKWPDDYLWEKSREMGATWLALILAVWLCLFHKSKRVLCISHSEGAVRKAADEGTLFAKVDFILDHLPEWLKPGVIRRKLGYGFPGRSSLSGVSPTQRSGVGDRVSLVILDEFSKQREAAAIWGQTADTGPRLVIGTHYGVGTYYYELSRRPDLPKAVLHWSQHPDKRKGLYRVGENRKVEVLVPDGLPAGYDFMRDGSPAGGPYPGLRSQWYDRECVRRHSVRDVAMHLDIDPQGSSSQVFDALEVGGLIRDFAVEPYWEGVVESDGVGERLVEKRGGAVKLWCPVDASGRPPESVYSGGADVSTGTGSTPSCLSVMNDRGEKVLEYADARIGVDDFAVLSAAVGRLFRAADGRPTKLGWETNGPGSRYGIKLAQVGYTNVYYHTNEMRLSRPVADRPGWPPGAETKRVLLENYRGALFERRLVNRSKLAMQELLSFEYTPRGQVEHAGQVLANDPAGSGENHGDRAVADAIMWLVGSKSVTAWVEPKRSGPVQSLAWRRMLAARVSED